MGIKRERPASEVRPAKDVRQAGQEREISHCVAQQASMKCLAPRKSEKADVLCYIDGCDEVGKEGTCMGMVTCEVYTRAKTSSRV